MILSGYSNSKAGFSKSQPFLCVTDLWLVKLKPNGTQKWDKTIGGSLGDYLVFVQQTKDGCFLLRGIPTLIREIIKRKTQNHTATDEKANVTICTPSGKVVFATVLPPSITGTSTHTFNVAGLSRGIYYVNMVTGDKTQKTTKVVVKE